MADTVRSESKMPKATLGLLASAALKRWVYEDAPRLLLDEATAKVTEPATSPASSLLAGQTE